MVHFDDGDAGFAVEACDSPERSSCEWQHDGRDTVGARVDVRPAATDRCRLTLVHDALRHPGPGVRRRLALAPRLARRRIAEGAAPPAGAWRELAEH